MSRGTAIYAAKRLPAILRTRTIGVITCVIQYTFDPHQLPAFEEYATHWTPIIGRCGGELVGYYLPVVDSPQRVMY
jgi:hypothetical protein